jgi:glutamate--cysteine ligase
MVRAQAKAIAAELGLGFLAVGFDPKWRVEDVPIMPKGRYHIMREYMPKRGSLGHDMMFRSTTIQVGIAAAAILSIQSDHLLLQTGSSCIVLCFVSSAFCHAEGAQAAVR